MKRLTAGLCFLLALICIASAGMFSAFAENKSLKGTGQALDPYLIESAEDLCTFRDMVNGGVSFEGQYVLQTADLDLSGIENFTPIGIFESGCYFYGIYNGGGHTISNLTVRSDKSVAGLFGQLGGTVMNLGIESGSISGSSVAAIAGHAVGANAKVLNCYNLATLQGFRVGGIVNSFVSGTVVDCWNAGTLTGTEVGGIVGYQAAQVISCTTFGDAELLNTTFFSGYEELNRKEAYSEERIAALKTQFSEHTRPYSSYLAQMMQNALKGEGTEQKPYLIESVEDLCRFRAFVNLGCSFNGYWIRQTVDLDLSSIENWVPIGEYGKNCYFYGVYDGAGHSISNLTILGKKNSGLFGMLAGTVMNLGIESGRIEGACVGAIASHGTGTVPMIVNCYNKATVEGTLRAGGIVDNFGGGIIANCLNLGKVSGQNQSGGIASYGAKRIVNSFSVGSPVRGEGATGIAENSCAQVETVEEAVSRLNKGLYSVANRTDYQHNNLYRWEADGSHGGRHNYLLRFIIQEVLIALAVFGLMLCFFLLLKGYRHTNRLSLCGVKQELSEQKLRWLGGMNERLKMIVTAGFVFGFGMVAVAYLNGDHTITRAFFWPDSKDAFMDFINPMQSVLSNNYAQEGHYTAIGGTYPPIARAAFWIVGQILPSNMQMYSAAQIKSNYGTLLVFFVLALSMVALLFVYRWLGKTKAMTFAMFAVFSSPMLFMVDRGNIVIFALLFCAIFVAGYRSENPLIRHIAYICLGLAAALKIYPVVLGLLVVKEKKWKRIIPCVVYGVIFCVLPFFFIGGFSELVLYIRNVTTSFGKNAVNVNEWLLNYGNVLAGWGENFLGDAAIGRTVARFSLYPVTLLLAACVFLAKERWKAVLAACMIIVLYPGYSVFYCAAFFAIPLMCFLAADHHRRIDYVYAVGFLLVLMPLQFLCGALGVTQDAMWQFVGSAGVILALILIVDCIVSFVGGIKKKQPIPAEPLPVAEAE